MRTHATYNLVGLLVTRQYTKKTLYWVRNLPPLVADIDHPNPKEYVRSSRGKYRSRTFPELAQAIARQWSSYILDDIAK